MGTASTNPLPIWRATPATRRSKKTLKGEFGELPINIPRDRPRPLDALYPIVYLDCIHVKVRDNGTVRTKAVYLALGVNLAGEKELLGRRNWTRIIPFFSYPPEIRKVIYTTNAIESVNMSLRKVSKNRGSFPSDDAVLKLYYLVLEIISKKWTMPIRDWKAALNRFTIQFEDRMPQH